jgi:hypothetical protein
MKIDVSVIVINHILSFKDNRSGRFDWLDVVIFYFLPLFISLGCMFFELVFDRDAYNASLTVYSIFAALLLSVQVAIFGIFQRGWRKPEDPKLLEAYEKSVEERRCLLEELNVNISYLLVLSCFSVSYFVVVYALKLSGSVASVISAFLYIHFALTLLMVIKRSYALFDREYRQR